MNADAVLAAHRFGLGAGRRELDAMRGDPRGWLKHQCQSLEPITRPFAGQKSTAEVVRALPEYREAAKASPDDMVKLQQMGREMFINEMRPWMRNAFDNPAPFLERYVWFWSNHFTISVLKQRMIFVAGGYEREAIRPHVLGKFEDLLTATVRHPAMLLYLDNAFSIGPDSPAGRFTGRGLNENHAREILELHTMGVGSGYTQADVIELARILTGWSVDRKGEGSDNGFRFFPNRHQPGTKTLLGKTYAEAGEEEGRQALRDLARQPATARHIATKLGRHFIADEPPPQAIARLERVFRDTGGDLKALALAVVDEPLAWQPTFAKMRTPIEFVVAAVRLLGGGQQTLGDQFTRLAESLRIMGQVPFTAQSPKGWPDVAAAWAGPAAIMERVQWAHALAKGIAAKPDPAALATAALGPLIAPPTRDAVARAADAAQGLALLLASPEFQRR
jgi:uncharacterized protein (DUF1800 family)